LILLIIFTVDFDSSTFNLLLSSNVSETSINGRIKTWFFKLNFHNYDRAHSHSLRVNTHALKNSRSQTRKLFPLSDGRYEST